MTTKPTPKTEAVRALDDAIARLAQLDATGLYDALSSKLLAAALERAREQVEAIQELKRPRRKEARDVVARDPRSS